MRHPGINRKAIAWSYMGWLVLALIALVIILFIMGAFSEKSFTILDKIFG